jgi:heme exporter protein D
MILPLAHIGHYLWILYVLPVLIVVASIVKTTISEKRAARTESASEQGPGSNSPDTPVEPQAPEP